MNNLKIFYVVFHTFEVNMTESSLSSSFSINSESDIVVKARAKYVIDRETGRQRGFGHIDFKGMKHDIKYF